VGAAESAVGHMGLVTTVDPSRRQSPESLLDAASHATLLVFSPTTATVDCSSAAGRPRTPDETQQPEPRRNKDMRLTHHERPGVTYLDLRGQDEEIVEPVSSLPIAPPGGAAREDWWLVLDFDTAGRLLGIEFLDPEAQLLPGVLADAERPAE
jgi:hypothetical protein